MGCHPSRISPEDADTERLAKQTSQQIDIRNCIDQKEDAKVMKLLLLGAGESGKSTVLKQMKQLYGEGYNETQRLGFRNDVFSNIFESMETLIAQSVRLADQFDTAVRPENLASKTFLEDAIEKRREDEMGNLEFLALDPTVVGPIKMLWADQGIQNTYEQRVLFQLPDSAHFFLDDIDRICEPNYVPNLADILHARVRTTGVIQIDFVINNIPFSVFDVGGQKSERRKWINSFDNVTSVIFMVAISEYNQVMWEDGTTNRLLESIELFDTVANYPCFLDKPIILFFNKSDLFYEKIYQYPLTTCFPDFTETPLSNTDEDFMVMCKRYLITRFQQRLDMTRKLYIHFTCATDTENIRVVFTACRHIVMRTTLHISGLVG